ncbi:MAG: hypothetical protein IPK82_00965 [Polyangiaceae bacterium]|nr:hypothetical protein [Polyangiaceae bacterium]
MRLTHRFNASMAHVPTPEFPMICASVPLSRVADHLTETLDGDDDAPQSVPLTLVCTLERESRDASEPIFQLSRFRRAA